MFDVYNAGKKEGTQGMKPTSPLTRPLGVWILTIYAALFVGIVPLLYILLLGGSTSELGLGIFLSIPIYLVTIYCAFKTWEGDRRVLNYFLLLVTFNYLLVGINNLVYLISNEVPSEESTRVLGRIVRGVLFPGIFIWYFRKRSTLRFFQNKSKDSSAHNQNQPSNNYEIVGVYKIEPTTETIKDAARFHKADWLLDDKCDLVDEINPGDYENLTLFELIITGSFSGCNELAQIKQDDQAPYMEFYLNINGTTVISERAAIAVTARKVCFFLHFTDITKPLEIGEMRLNLPNLTSLPDRLKQFTHYLPVD